MQPTQPFKTSGWSIRISEGLAWLFTAALFYWDRWAGLSYAAQIALVVAWAGYAIMRFCSLWRWHRNATRGEGLEQQFIQVGVAAIYGLLIASVAAFSHILSFLIYPIAVVLAAVSAINITLLYLWHKDPSHVPVNYYSHRKFTQEDA